MRLATALALAIGLALFFGLLTHYGFGSIAAAVASAGWGLLVVAVFRFVTITTDAAGWRALFSHSAKPALGPTVWVRWIGESVNSLLPVGQVGGDVARARLVSRFGVSRYEAGATVVADITLGLVTQILYTLIGVVLLMRAAGPRGDASRFFVGLNWGLLLAGVIVALFFLAQRLSLIRKLAGVVRAVGGGRIWDSLVGDAHEFDRSLAEVYQRRGQVTVGAAWRFLTWLLHTGETWLALYFLGVRVDLASALILESLSTAIRSAGFAIPAALGVQEGGLVLLGARVGLSPELSLALALVKRVRELLVGGPGLVAWTTMEGRWLFRRR